MENIKLSELLTLLLEFKKDPKPEKEIEIQNKILQFQVKPYMDIIDKKLALVSICNPIFNDYYRDGIELSAQLEMNKVVFGLLDYVINLENDLVGAAADQPFYDVLVEFGVVDHILEYCEKDYRRLEKMVDDTLNFANVQKITETAQYLKPENIESFKDVLRQMKKDLTPEMIADIKQIINAESPEWQAFKETVGDQILDQTINAKAEQTLNDYIKEKKKEPQEESKEDKPQQ